VGIADVVTARDFVQKEHSSVTHPDALEGNWLVWKVEAELYSSTVERAFDDAIHNQFGPKFSGAYDLLADGYCPSTGPLNGRDLPNRYRV
jgi:hypothetical protein